MYIHTFSLIQDDNINRNNINPKRFYLYQFYNHLLSLVMIIMFIFQVCGNITVLTGNQS